MAENLVRFSGGSGTSAAPYEISSQADLTGIINGLSDNNGYKNVYFKVMQDIKLDSSWPGIGVVEIVLAETGSPYVKSGTGFAGTLDGDGHTITVNRSGIDIQGVGGLINYLAPTGVLQNLTVAGKVDIIYNERPDWDYTVDGLSVIGGVVGYNSGTIDKVTSSVTVTAEDANDTIGLPCQVYDVGGIAGFNDNLYMKDAVGVIRNCSNCGSVTGYEKVGGIVGENAGLIASCSNTGVITTTSTRRSGTGGITGRNGNNNTAVETGSIWCCYNTGNILSGEAGDPDSQSSWIGGIAGFQNSLSTASNGYDKGELRGWGYAGYIVGCSNNGETVKDLTDHGVTRFYYPDGDATGAVKGSPDKEKGDPNSDEDLTINGELKDTSVMQDPNFVNVLKPSVEAYGKWVYEDNAFPGLAGNATAESGKAVGWEYKETNIYLDPDKGNDDNNGSAGSPVKSLDVAVSKAGIGIVHLMGTVTIDKSVTMYESTTFVRENPASFTDPMFIIDVPNDPVYGVNYVTIEGAVVDGKGVGTLFEVRQGRLRLRDNSKLENAKTGVLVQAKKAEKWAQAQLELNEVLIQADTAVEIAGETVNTGLGSDGTDTNNLILNTFGIYEIRLKGVVKLAAGAYMTVQNAQNFSGRMDVVCADPSFGRVIAVGAGYTLTAADAEDVTYGADDQYCTTIDANKMVLTRVVYLSGIGNSEGDGSKENPYNNLEDALKNTKEAGEILITNTVVLKGGTYNKNVRIRRAPELSDSDMMFDISESGSDVTLSGMIINGMIINGMKKGTIVQVSAGASLVLSGGVKLTDCEEAVAVASDATLSVLDAMISASKYSIHMEDDTATFILEPTTETRITGTVYLKENAIISVKSTLTTLIGKITVECSEPDDGMKVAMADGDDFSDFTETDAAKIVYFGNAYDIVIDMEEPNTLVLATPVTAS